MGSRCRLALLCVLVVPHVDTDGVILNLAFVVLFLVIDITVTCCFIV